ncbi:OmpA/MotB domain protein [Desulfonatronospira thiodismutans ASO3-1]|uniref:OmpA/MotB domain protein n=1 Tax=Desulfonatronospira thiodismutans ASO3-1 TaxID=555779 RepID=D6SJZ7_9BACT|nr:OmpA/MotB domain protein [Desulfonatronospira thiodismutans]EFI36200.1 OmpA/MotB domain protein [Desulfonatronospira thiodismutans ASO3-1]
MPLRTWITVFILLFLPLLLSGCSQSPVPVSHPYSLQKQMQAAKHWEIVAQDLGRDISEMLQEGNLQDPRVNVASNDISPFSQALESYLVTDLTRSGIRITSDTEDAYQLYWSVQSVTHKASRNFNRVPPGTGLLMGALGYGTYKLIKDGNAFAQSIGAGAGLETVFVADSIFQNRIPHNEIIINATVQKDKDIYYRLSNTYYIRDLDTDHYHFSRDLYQADADVETRTFNVKSR